MVFCINGLREFFIIKGCGVGLLRVSFILKVVVNLLLILVLFFKGLVYGLLIFINLIINVLLFKFILMFFKVFV